MHRDSAHTRELARGLRDLGVSVAERQLETWSQRGLLPRPGTPMAQLLTHVAEVAKVHRSGPGAAERTILILAARGFACSGLPPAVARAWGASSSKSLEALATRASEGLPDPETDEGSWETEQQVERLLGLASVQEVPRPLRDMLSGIVNAITREAKQRPVIDPVSGQRDSPVTTLLAVLSEILEAGYGHSSLGREATSVLGNALFEHPRELTPRGHQMIEDITPRLTSEPLNVLANFSDLEVGDLVRGARIMLAIFSQIPALHSVRSSKPREQLEYFAGMCAAIGVVVENLFTAL